MRDVRLRGRDTEGVVPNPDLVDGDGHRPEETPRQRKRGCGLSAGSLPAVETAPIKRDVRLREPDAEGVVPKPDVVDGDGRRARTDARTRNAPGARTIPRMAGFGTSFRKNYS
jgi:hypothetical protein